MLKTFLPWMPALVAAAPVIRALRCRAPAVPERPGTEHNLPETHDDTESRQHAPSSCSRTVLASLPSPPPWAPTAEQLTRADMATADRFAAWLRVAGETTNLTRRQLCSLYCEFVDYAELQPLSEAAFYRALRSAGILRHRLSAGADGRRPWVYSVRRPLCSGDFQINSEKLGTDMGGFGSGRQGSTKPLAESLRRLDLRHLSSDRVLRAQAVTTVTWSCRGQVAGRIGVIRQGDGMRLMYRTRTGAGAWQDVDETVPLSWTATRFGGHRPWFCCPRCGRRCRVLYGGVRFRCRSCHNVRYASQSETKADRATRAMFKIVRRLDPTADCNFLPPKPKGMHWRTYERLAQRYDAHDARWSAEAMRRFGLVI